MSEYTVSFSRRRDGEIAGTVKRDGRVLRESVDPHTLRSSEWDLAAAREIVTRNFDVDAAELHVKRVGNDRTGMPIVKAYTGASREPAPFVPWTARGRKY